MIIEEKNLKNLIFPLKTGDRIFLQGVPGAGKTTFAQELIRHHMWDKHLTIVSPTYTYYQKYGDNIYHFDLYRAQNLEDILRIGADDIFEDAQNICLIEWPEIIRETVSPTKVVDIALVWEERYFEIYDVKTE
jgi:tRNA threonylcarbamoyladenosine biosynthesis protein TsaE